MEKLNWISVNNKLNDGVKLINGLSTKKFSLLLECVSSAEGPRIFTSEELLKLQESLNLDEDQVQLLIQSLVYIFKQASKVILKPTDLQRELIENLGFESSKGEEFLKAWSSETKKHFGDFENRWKLNNMAWELNVELNKSETVPKVRMQLDVSNSEDNQDKILLELNEEELVNLYTTLENIQTKLDKIQT